MKVLFVLAKYYPYVGGAELLFQRLAEGLVDRGHEVKVITSKIKGCSQREHVNGVKIERVRFPFSSNPFLFSIFSVPSAVKLAKEFDVIQTSSNYSALSAIIAAKIAQKRIVLSCLEVLGKNWKLAVTNKLSARFFQFVEHLIVHLPYDWIISISEATQRDLLASGINPEKCEVVHCGADHHQIISASEKSMLNLNWRNNYPEIKFFYLYYGRPGRTKGIRYLIDAVPLIESKIPGSKLVMVLSSSPEKEYLKVLKQIAQKNLQDKIILVPTFEFREDLFAFIAQVDCIVIPSITEGFGFTTVEASSLDVVVVASNTGSIPEVIFGRYVLVEPINSIAIMEGVVKAYSGETSFLEPREYSWERMVEDYEVCYERITR